MYLSRLSRNEPQRITRHDPKKLERDAIDMGKEVANYHSDGCRGKILVRFKARERRGIRKGDSNEAISTYVHRRAQAITHE